MSNEEEARTHRATHLIGQYLVLSSWMEKHINSCLDHFQFDRPVFDSIEKESFDFKCKRLRNYLQMLEAYGQISDQPLTSIYENLGSLEVEFSPIRKMRNLLAHAVVIEGEIHSSRRARGENSYGICLSIDELQREVEKLEKVLAKSKTFFHYLENFLKQLSHKKRAPNRGPQSSLEI